MSRSHLAFPICPGGLATLPILAFPTQNDCNTIRERKNKSQVQTDLKNGRVKIKWWEDATKNSSTEWSLWPASVLPHVLGASPVIITEWKKADVQFPGRQGESLFLNPLPSKTLKEGDEHVFCHLDWKTLFFFLIPASNDLFLFLFFFFLINHVKRVSQRALPNSGQGKKQKHLSSFLLGIGSSHLPWK